MPCLAVPPTGVPVYTVAAIGGITGLRVNQVGDVVGWTTRNGLAVPMLHTPENGTIVLPTSSTQPYGVARDLSERAAGVITVVGEARLNSSGSAIHAVRWRVAIPQGIVTSVTDLGVLPGGSESAAYAVNDADQIAGTSDSGSSLSIHSFIYSPAKGMTDLGLGSTGTSARALDMNGSGLVAGYLGLQAFRWSTTGGLDLLGTPAGWANSFAFAINSNGQVAGSASGAFGNSERVARYTDGAGWKILGGTGEDNVGNGINQWGDVVGTGLLDTLRQGLIYTDNLGLLAMIDDLLFVPGSWRIMAAYDINDAQQITGWAIDNATGLRSAVLLTPVSPPPPNQPPVAKFTYSCTASLFCSFDGSGSTDDRGILAWAWTVAGHQISVLQSEFIGVQFNAPQTINLTLTVTDTRGITDSITQTVVIGEPGLALAVKSLVLNQSEVAGCKSLTGSVTISAPAPADGTVIKLSDTLLSATAPATVTVPSGAITKAFWIKTAPVATSEVGLFSATLGSSSTQSQSLKVRPIGPVSVTLLPNPEVGGKSVVGTAKLECNAGPGPVNVVVASSNTAVASPVAASIYVPQGLQSATFAVVTSTVLARTTASISGTANGISKSKTLTVVPAASISPTSLKFGSVRVGLTSSVLNATLTNNGAIAFNVSNVSLVGTAASWFGIKSNNCQSRLAAGASCTIGVAFKPLVAASASAKLSIATGATSTPLSVVLSGTGF
jgi:probable HAF family extracellular repeat protein